MNFKFLVALFVFLIQGAWGMGSDGKMSLASYFPKHNYQRYDAEVDKGEPYLYEIRVPDSKVLPEIDEPHHTRFYLLGSQHDVPIEILQRVTHFIAERADVLITEIYSSQPRCLGKFDDISKDDLVAHGSINLQEEMDWTQLLSLQSLKILKDHITPKTQKLWNVDASQVSYAVINAYLSDRDASWHYYHHHGMDNGLIAYFKANQNPILALEDGSVRIKAANDLDKLKKENLSNVILSLERHLQNYEAVTKQPTEEDVQTPQLYPSFFLGLLKNRVKEDSVINRNKAWVPTLKKHLVDHQTKNILICVGFGHFEGGQSFLELLTQDGFELIRICKKGHTQPRISSFCNYLMGYTYEELLKEAAKEMILNRPLPKDKAYQDIAQKRYEADYQEFLSILDFYQQPNLEDYEFGPGQLAHLCIHQHFKQYTDLIRQYAVDPRKHSVFQRSNDGEYYVANAFETDLDFAVTLIERQIIKAKSK